MSFFLVYWVGKNSRVWVEVSVEDRLTWKLKEKRLEELSPHKPTPPSSLSYNWVPWTRRSMHWETELDFCCAGAPNGLTISRLTVFRGTSLGKFAFVFGWLDTEVGLNGRAKSSFPLHPQPILFPSLSSQHPIERQRVMRPKMKTKKTCWWLSKDRTRFWN